MKIYTQTGDQGNTALLGGSRVSKSNIQIEAYGTVDELNAHLGNIRSSLQQEDFQQVIIKIQRELFQIGAELAKDSKSTKTLALIDADNIIYIENQIDTMEAKLPKLKHFILPGSHPIESAVQIARTVCRRAERRVVALYEIQPVNPLIIQYLNRLSDYLFVLARFITHNEGAEEIKV